VSACRKQDRFADWMFKSKKLIELKIAWHPVFSGCQAILV
jgi:hypothetical protein